MVGTAVLPYRHSKLGPTEIRLVHLHAGSVYDPLTIHLEYVDINCQPEYEALSYTWGEPIKEYTVGCETSKGTECISVTRNLAGALLRLRQPGKARRLWIDQLCINQIDTAERNTQVGLMDKVYARAQQVLIWIGEEGDDARLAFDFVPIWLSETGRGSRPSSSRQGQEIAFSPSYNANASLLMVRSPSWEALSRVFSRPWFSRAWVIQETVLAKRAIVYCGRIRFDVGQSGNLSLCDD